MALDPSAASRTLREIAVLASRGIPVVDLLNVLADKLDPELEDTADAH